MKHYKLLLSLLFVILSFGCSTNEVDNNIYDPTSTPVQVVLNQGSASSIKLVPYLIGDDYYEEYVVYKENTNKVSSTLPSLTDHIVLTIKGNQKEYSGYIFFYGIKKEFTVTNWDYDSTFYLPDLHN